MVYTQSCNRTLALPLHARPPAHDHLGTYSTSTHEGPADLSAAPPRTLQFPYSAATVRAAASKGQGQNQIQIRLPTSTTAEATAVTAYCSPIQSPALPPRPPSPARRSPLVASILVRSGTRQHSTTPPACASVLR
jgi:hypothetical protein